MSLALLRLRLSYFYLELAINSILLHYYIRSAILIISCSEPNYLSHLPWNYKCSSVLFFSSSMSTRTLDFWYEYFCWWWAQYNTRGSLKSFWSYYFSKLFSWVLTLFFCYISSLKLFYEIILSDWLIFIIHSSVTSSSSVKLWVLFVTCGDWLESCTPFAALDFPWLNFCLY